MKSRDRHDAELLRQQASTSTVRRTARCVRRKVRLVQLEHVEEEVVVVSCRDEQAIQVQRR